MPAERTQLAEDKLQHYFYALPKAVAGALLPNSATQVEFIDTQGLSTRITSQDEVFQDVHVPKGSLLHLRWAAGNVDPDEWECPYEMRLERKAVTRHLAVSAGPRVCPGAGISRLEQSIAWNRLLDRIDRLEYAPGNTFEHQPGIMLGTLKLHLRFTRTPQPARGGS